MNRRSLGGRCSFYLLLEVMKKNLGIALGGLALAGFGFVLLKDWHTSRGDAPAALPSVPSAGRSVIPETKTAPISSGQAVPQSIPMPGKEVRSMLDELQRDMDLLLRDGDDAGAHRRVDEAISSSSFSGIDQQRLMVIKLGLFARQGEHRAMLPLMDRIIAEAPDSPLAAAIARQRPAIELASTRSPNDPGPCATCGEVHPVGIHPSEPSSER